MRRFYTLISLTVFAVSASAQNIGIGTNTPSASALLEIKASNKGLLIPRTSTTSRTAIVNPAKGLMVYDTTTGSFWFHNGSVWSQIGGGGSGWSLTGNTGTDSLVNFIGTADAKPLYIRVNNITSGYLDYNPQKGNTAFGCKGFIANTTGISNTSVGYASLNSNSTGSRNTATGLDALNSNINGDNNTAVGAFALLYNSSGMGNVGTGINALLYNGGGNNNTATGTNALYYNVNGYSNVAMGVGALFNNTETSNSVAIGDSALFNNDIAYNFTGSSKGTAIGSKSLFSNTTGYENTATGSKSLYANVDGYWNTAVGSSTMDGNTSGYLNTGLGFRALSWNMTGSHNTSAGAHDLIIVTGAEYDNNTTIGYNTQILASNAARIGNSSVSSIGGQVGWSNFSDERIKNNVQENVPGIAFIKQLRPVTYNFSLAKENDLLGIKNDTSTWKTKYDIEKINFTGFIAQEVDAAAKKMNYDFSAVDKTGAIWALRYSEFVVPLVKAVQEQQAIIETLQQQVESIKAGMPVQIVKQQQMIEDLKKDKEEQNTKIELLIKEIQLVKEKLK